MVELVLLGEAPLGLLLTISPRPSKKVRTVVSSSSTESDILARSTQSRGLVGDMRRPEMNRGKFWRCLIVGHKEFDNLYRSLSWPKDSGRLVGPDVVPLSKSQRFRAWRWNREYLANRWSFFCRLVMVTVLRHDYDTRWGKILKTIVFALSKTSRL